MDSLITLQCVAGGLFAALGVFLTLAAFFKKGCGWLLFGVVALGVSIILGINCSGCHYSTIWLIGAAFGALILAVVRFFESE